MYAKVENGTVIKTMGQLPKVYTFADGSKTGNFDLVDVSTLLGEGFYPVVEEVVTFDPKKQIKVFSGYTVNETNVTRNYTVTDIDLNVLKTEKKTEIERYTQSLISKSKFEFDGNIFTLDLATPDNAVQLNTVTQTTGVFPNPFSWTDSYGVEVPMTEAKFNNFIAALGAYKLGIIVTGKTHKAYVDSKITSDEVVDYDYSTGWGNYVEPPNEEDII